MRWRVSPVWWLLVITGLPGLTIGLALLSGDQLKDVSLPSLLPKQVVLLLINLLVINLWERPPGQESSRRGSSAGTACSRISPDALPVRCSARPPRVLPRRAGHCRSLVGAFISYFILGLLVRPLFAVVLRATGDSLLLVGLMHAVFNRTNNENGIAAKLLEETRASSPHWSRSSCSLWRSQFAFGPRCVACTAWTSTVSHGRRRTPEPDD
jgi:hypothetical protein